MTNNPLLEVKGLRTELEAGADTVVAVDGVTFAIYPGETLGIVGESGCGKSMTAFSLMGLLPSGGKVTSGQILFDGQDLAKFAEKRLRTVRGQDIGMVFQDPMTALNPTMTVFDQVAEPLRIHTDMNRQQVRERVIETLRLVGIPRPEERLSSYPHQFSGGLRQRVAIAIALVCQPKLLIADEPTTALDVTIQRQILELIDGLRRRLNMAVMLVTHDLGVIAQHADRVAVMYAGKVVETATTEELFKQPKHRYTQGLFAALPERAANLGAPLRPIPGSPPDLARAPKGCRFADRCPAATDECREAQPPTLVVSASHRHSCIHPVPETFTAMADPDPALEAEDRPAMGGGQDATDARPVLVLENLVKNYAAPGSSLFGKKRLVSAVADVSFTVAEGETFGLVGESGCGKSTIARMITALDAPSSGKVEVLGTDLFAMDKKELRQQRRNIQLMFQDPSASMDGRLRGAGVVREPLSIHGIGNRRTRAEDIMSLLDQVGLPRRFADRYPHELSGGQRQRLALARSLALKPRIIVADEPVSALDVSVQAQILNLMRDLQKDTGISYVFVSHDLSVVRYMSQRIGVMYLGKLVETGPAESVYQRPFHPYTRGLIESAPSPDVHAARTIEVKGELPSPLNPPSGCRFRTRCPLAQELCAKVEPPLRELAPGHFGACHFPLNNDSSLGSERSMAGQPS
ncbi:ABC transporter ATP-binding protein [Paenarthrobacter ureafaciens]|uniref:ABC transporter ATP-binding protein n=1 Tax=Paenarthrobacter ureafaciens TaxID=37931 RepID=UPI002DBA6C39|nr:ABC transporter ATP-binding protein [Paenarthrobacter ureafaciens]MEC3853142.1 ABC transporter ATP-binding protein [Paenarthrobacter ureafaciens]